MFQQLPITVSYKLSSAEIAAILKDAAARLFTKELQVILKGSDPDVIMNALHIQLIGWKLKCDPDTLDLKLHVIIEGKNQGGISGTALGGISTAQESAWFLNAHRALKNSEPVIPIEQRSKGTFIVKPAP
ncbi:MAG: hypothetical protein EB059_01180 [Alphaproteobacteria bacterium]|nr:hypothetical protein [Alphaproteobacteria bacterium]